jgi:Na+-transporting methylmalonyl-CoA/oxaloacetate decarboxylase gamma subunit
MLTDPLFLFLAIVFIAIVGAFVVEVWAIKTGRPTISQRFQELNQAMSKQLIIGFGILIGLIIGWFAAHFTSFC